jgi:hypothetical protein
MLTGMRIAIIMISANWARRVRKIFILNFPL